MYEYFYPETNNRHDAAQESARIEQVGMGKDKKYHCYIYTVSIIYC